MKTTDGEKLIGGRLNRFRDMVADCGRPIGFDSEDFTYYVTDGNVLAVRGVGEAYLIPDYLSFMDGVRDGDQPGWKDLAGWDGHLAMLKSKYVHDGDRWILDANGRPIRRSVPV